MKKLKVPQFYAQLDVMDPKDPTWQKGLFELGVSQFIILEFGPGGGNALCEFSGPAKNERKFYSLYENGPKGPDLSEAEYREA